MATRPDPRFQAVEATLEQYRLLTQQYLLRSLPIKEPRRYLYDIVASYPERAGKGLRPALCIATCQAFGGRAGDALLSAVSIEMFHNAFLVHDDIEDESEYRRGMPTLHSEYGIGVAVNVGDAMNVLSIRPLMGNLSRLSPQITWAVFAEIEHMLLQSTEGQAMELGWVRDNACDLKEDDYLRMTLKKTCWYTCMHPCRIGYLIAQGDTSGLDRFNRFGYYMGAAFQITDDVLNLVGDRQKYGKEIGGDILEGKRTLTLVHCLNNSTRREKSRLKSFLATPRSHRTADDVDWVYTQFEKYGSIKYARSAARQLAGAALREFHVAFKDAEESAAKSFVREIILYMVDRDF